MTIESYYIITIEKLRAEVALLKTARDGFYDDTVELRKECIALREKLAACHEGYCSGEGEIASLRAEVKLLRADAKTICCVQYETEIASLRADWAEDANEYEEELATFRAEVEHLRAYANDLRPVIAERDALHVAAQNLRQAQRNYMADRGNDALGKLVAEAAQEMDAILKMKKHCRPNSPPSAL